MKICGRGFSEHLRLLAPLFGLLAAVWALRMVLYAVDAPHFLMRWCSMTVAAAACVMLAVFMIHLRHFGSYPNVVLAALLIVCCQQLLIVLAMGVAMLTGTSNVYLAPEFSYHLSPRAHLYGHLTGGMAFGTIFGSAMGCLLLWLLRKLVPLPANQ